MTYDQQQQQKNIFLSLTFDTDTIADFFFFKKNTLPHQQQLYLLCMKMSKALLTPLCSDVSNQAHTN